MKRQSICVTGLVCIAIAATTLSPAAAASSNTARTIGRKAYPQVVSGTGAWASGDARQTAGGSPAATPNCGKGVRPRKIVSHCKAKRHNKAGYRADTLYCGDAKYGYRHLQPHIAQYFGGWGAFNYSISAVLKRPAHWVVQSNGNFRESAPIYQCFYAGYYIIWTFYVVPTIQSGSIVTAYGHKGKTVDQPCSS
jgi:hypothetical protein